MKLLFWCNDGFVRLGFVELMINPSRQRTSFQCLYDASDVVYLDVVKLLKRHRVSTGPGHRRSTGVMLAGHSCSMVALTP